MLLFHYVFCFLLTDFLKFHMTANIKIVGIKDSYYSRMKHLANRLTNVIMSYSEDNIDHVGGVILNKATTGYVSINFPDTVTMTAL